MDDDSSTSTVSADSLSVTGRSVEGNQSVNATTSSDDDSSPTAGLGKSVGKRKRRDSEELDDSTTSVEDITTPIKRYRHHHRRTSNDAILPSTSSSVPKLLFQTDEHGNQESLPASQGTVEIDRNSPPRLLSSCYSHSSGSDVSDSNRSSESATETNSDCESVPEGSASDSEEVGLCEDDFLYPGSDKQTDSVVLELLDCYLNNKWTKNSLKDTLNLFTSCLPNTHNLPKTPFTLFGYLKKFSPDTVAIKHYYCADNLHAQDSKVDVCFACDCKVINTFFELPIDGLIKYLFEHRQLAALLDSYYQKVQSKPANTSNVIYDITDGSEYKRVREACTVKYDITLTFNTYGIKPHVSSNAKLWPVIFTIMEIPPELRSSLIVVTGIWFDPKKKPDMQIYLKPFVNSLEKIYREGGVTWCHPKTGVQHTSQVFAPLIVADAPARADVQGIQGHNSKHACNICEQKTSKLTRIQVPPGVRRPPRQRRFLMKEQPALLRDHNRMIAQGNKAVNENVTQVKGVKKVPVISSIPLLDLATCMVPEYMHSVLKGVVLQFALLWFTVKGEWYIGNHKDDIDEFLLSEIHPPNFVTRVPRSVSELPYWKANELRSWLLYYSLIVISLYMDDKYVQHWMLLVTAIFILLKDEICKSDLDRAELLLRIFVRDVGSLYRDSEYVYNVHQLLHLRLSDERWGPLWSNSAFVYESLNGVLSQMVHGTKNQVQELVNQVLISQGAQILRNQVVKIELFKIVLMLSVNR